MKHLRSIKLSAIWLCLLVGGIAYGEVITQLGWDYDRGEFRDSEEDIAAHRQENKRMPLSGWAEYDIEVAESGWYELWFGGAPPSWNRDVFIDGEVVSRLSSSDSEADIDDEEIGRAS
ncbi:MAG: hypothetical protein ACQKBV_00195, partial [Puniceicoccales bacterium]